MKKVIVAMAVSASAVLFYACNRDDNNATPAVTGPALLTTTLTPAPATSGLSTATGSFNGSLDRTSRVLSYTVTYAGVSPTAITLDPVSTSTPTGGTNTFPNSILLAGNFPTASVSIPGSGTSTTPGSGTSTTPGSGTSTTPGSGTSTTPGSGTSTTPGSGTSTTPGSGTGTGTGITIANPLTGTTSLSQTRADSLSRGLYRINIRTSAFPNGAIGGVIQTR